MDPFFLMVECASCVGVPLGFVEGMEEVFGKARGALPWHSSKASLDIAPSQVCMDYLAAIFGLEVFKVVSNIGGTESSFCGWI